MGTKSLSIQSLFKLSAVCSLTLALVFGSANLAKAESRAEAVNRLTDWFFYQVNPGLNYRPLTGRESRYIREWRAIHQVVEQEMEPSQGSCAGDSYWALSNYDIPGEGDRGLVSQSFNRIADAIFYSRNPQLAGYKIPRSNSKKAREWLTIRRSIAREHPCY
jgi:hypothetical protein